MKLAIIAGLTTGNIITAALGFSTMGDAIERSIFQAVAIGTVVLLDSLIQSKEAKP